MKNKNHILYFLIFVMIATPVFGEPTKLLGIKTEEYGGNQYMVLELMDLMLSMLLQSAYPLQHYRLALEMFFGIEEISKKELI